MEEQFLGYLNHVMLSRIQFGLTAVFHILWPVLTIGLSSFLFIWEWKWLRTRDLYYYHQIRFWLKIFIINFAIGVATGIVMEFQFGTNWDAFAIGSGPVFGHMLGFEAAMSFMLEAAFVGVMMFGWSRVSPRMHFLSTTMVFIAAYLSGFWILAANSWMQTPTGGFIAKEGHFQLMSNWDSIMNPDTKWGVGHMLVACVEISLFVVGGVSAGYLLRRRNSEFFLRSFKFAAIIATFITPLQIFMGDGSGRMAYTYQPAKLAAMEAHWETNPHGSPAAFHLIAWPDQQKQENIYSIYLPYALSLITTRSLRGQVLGLKEFPVEDQPPVWYTFYAFRLMLLFGFWFFFLMLYTMWLWWKRKLRAETIHLHKKFLWAWIISLPLSYMAMECGWITREVGRQPWTMYGLLRTVDSASSLPPATVGTSLWLFAFFYLTLITLFVVFVRSILRKGPKPERPPAVNVKGRGFEDLWKRKEVRRERA